MSSADHGQSSSPSKINIAIVEDHQLTRVGLKLALAHYPEIHISLECVTGNELINRIDLMKEPPVQLVLMDIGLPGLSGVDTAQRIKEEHPQIKVLMLTSKDSDATIAAALSAKCDGYCLKDSPVESLIDAIRSVLKGNIWLEPSIARRVVKVYVDNSSESDKSGSLTQRETEVLRLLVQGLSNQGIADALNISPETVKTHMRKVMEKLSVSDRTQAAVAALKLGLV